MEHYDVVRLGLILAVQAEIEAMKAENLKSKADGVYPAYTYEFYEKAEKLRNLAYCHNEQL